jgi:hypothetical protein
MTEPGRRSLGEGGGRQRVAVLCWVAIAFVVWNGSWDIVLRRAENEYLLRHAMHEAGRGPAVTIDQFMGPARFDAAWQATVVAGLILMAALLTIRYLAAPPRR